VNICNGIDKISRGGSLIEPSSQNIFKFTHLPRLVAIQFYIATAYKDGREEALTLDIRLIQYRVRNPIFDIDVNQILE
jgi:hypothetical protein